MVNIDFLSFVYLVVVSIVVSLVMARLPKVKIVLPGGLTVNLIVGYLGAWLGTPVFGKWKLCTIGTINIISAILGAIALIILANACVKCCKK